MHQRVGDVFKLYFCIFAFKYFNTKTLPIHILRYRRDEVYKFNKSKVYIEFWFAYTSVGQRGIIDCTIPNIL